MRKTTNKKRGLFGAVVAAIVTGAAAILLAFWFFVLADLIQVGADERIADAASIFLVFYGLIFVVIAVGVVIALVQRWKEIKGGEEDEAKKY